MIEDSLPVARTTMGRAQDHVFYAGMAVAIVAAVAVGFAPTYYLRPRFVAEPLPLYLHVHGAVFTSWIVLFLMQTTLVSTRRIDVHRRLGWAGAAIAALMVIAGVTAAIISGRVAVEAGFEDEALTFLTTPLSSMLVFLILVAAAVRARCRPQTHKRLMLLATISILDAAVARWPLELASTTWGSYLFTDAFIAAAVLVDLRSHRSVHPAYLWGGLLVLVGQFSRDPIGRTEAWHAIARAIIG